MPALRVLPTRDSFYLKSIKINQKVYVGIHLAFIKNCFVASSYLNAYFLRTGKI